MESKKSGKREKLKSGDYIGLWESIEEDCTEKNMRGEGGE